MLIPLVDSCIAGPFQQWVGRQCWLEGVLYSNRAEDHGPLCGVVQGMVPVRPPLWLMDGGIAQACFMPAHIHWHGDDTGGERPHERTKNCNSICFSWFTESRLIY